jgi:hypothetical protein
MRICKRERGVTKYMKQQQNIIINNKNTIKLTKLITSIKYMLQSNYLPQHYYLVSSLDLDNPTRFLCAKTIDSRYKTTNQHFERTK